MYGQIVNLTVAPEKRDDVIAILKEGTAAMPGCFSYVVAKDPSNEDAIWVTEVWDSESSHDASLSLPSVQNAITQVKPVISRFERIAITEPVCGVGLPATAAG